MSKKFTFNLFILAFFLVYSMQSYSQCTFTGLLPSYCSNNTSSTLTPASSNTLGYFYGPGITGSVFSPTLAGSGTHTITYAICASNYSITSGTYSPAPASGSVVSLNDDQVSTACAIGFTFKFFCNNYTDFYISSNGFITFNSTNSTNNNNGCCQGLSMPTFNVPDEMIAAAWVDLHPPSSSGAITYTTLGTQPNRRCVVTYSNINHYNSASYCCPITTQIILYETTNVIEIHTGSKPLPTSTSTSYSTTMGIQNLGGSTAFVVAGRNASPTWTASSEMYRWTPIPSCLSTQTTVVSPSGITVAGNNSICAGSSTTLSANGNTTYTWSTASNSSSIVASPSVTTTYSVSGTNGSGCVSNGAITVTVFPGIPTLAISSSTNLTCPGKSTTLTASGAASYTWSGGITNAQGFTTSATTAYTVTGSNSCGSSTAAITISVAPIQITAISSPTSVCAGNPVTLTAVSAGNSYTWNPFGIPGASVVVSPTANTVYTVTTSDGTCTGTQTLPLTVSPVPTITSAASATSICDGVPVTLTANGGLSYTWSPGSLTGSVITVTPNAPVLYTVVGSNASGCLGGSSQVIIVNPSPTLAVSVLDPVICAGGSTSLTVSGANNYVWSSGGTSSVEPVSPTQTTTYSVTGTAATNTCATTETIEVQVFIPNVTITGNTVICQGGTSSLVANGATSYTWDPGSSPFQGITVNPSVTSVYTVTAISPTGNINCQSTNTVQVTVNPNPTVTAVSSRSAICKDESVVLTAGGASTYTWNNGSHSTTISATGTLITTLNFSVNGTNAQGCSNFAVVQVKVNACNGVAETNPLEARLDIFPNPNSGEFTIKYNTSIQLNIVNELGELVGTINLNDTNGYKQNVNGLASGVYFISGQKDGRKVNQKIVVTK